MVPIVLGALVVMVIVLCVFVAVQPNQFKVAREAWIAAPPEKVFPLVNELHNWESWSPWAKRDPNMKLNYAGPPSGTGASYAWVGNKHVGEGRLTISESRPSEFIRINLEFFKPFKANNTAEFRFASEDGKTRVTWTMFGDNNFLGKAIGLMMDMDKMIGGDFEAGLASIRATAESTQW